MKAFADTLRNIDYGQLPISDYSRNYVRHMLPAIDYYLQIYSLSLQKIQAMTGKALSETTIVDYGGGHGFFSIMAKSMGVQRVIYVDYNPQATEAVRAIAREAGVGPDHVLLGDAATLRAWCAESGVLPDMLAGFDVIEHIYRLDTFFADVHAIDPQVKMLFTTASNPLNPIIVRRLHKAMRADERGEGGFMEQRRRHIAAMLPGLADGDLLRLAKATRGLTFEDIDSLLVCQGGSATVSRHPGLLAPSPNTCDPSTGSWTERLLPLDAYRQLLAPYGRKVRFESGFYNPDGRMPYLRRLVNKMLGRNMWLAPFVFIEISE